MVRGHSALGFPASHILFPCDAPVPVGPTQIILLPARGRCKARREVVKRTDGVWGTPCNVTSSSPLRRVQGPHCFEALQTGGCRAFLSSPGSLPL